MKRSIRAAALLALLSCTPDPPVIVGSWRNGTAQTLHIQPDLTGRVTQSALCSQDLGITMHRDPFDSYAIRFEIGQRVLIPAALKAVFGDAQYFCSSAQSTAMCRFCVPSEDGTQLLCEATEQTITGYPVAVTHDCTWTRVSTAAAPRSPACATLDAGICMGTGTPPPAGADAAAGDGSAPDAGPRD